MKTLKITKNFSVKDYQKRQKQLIAIQQKVEEEARFNAKLSEIAKSMLPTNLKYQLKVIDADTFTPQNVSSITSEVVGSNSIWAPWSPNYKR